MPFSNFNATLDGSDNSDTKKFDLGRNYGRQRRNQDCKLMKNNISVESDIPRGRTYS